MVILYNIVFICPGRVYNYVGGKVPPPSQEKTTLEKKTILKLFRLKTTIRIDPPQTLWALSGL